MTEQTKTWVRVPCETCGTVRVPADTITLRVCDDDGSTSVRYRCPSCGWVQLAALDAERAALLAACDEIAVETWQTPVVEQAPRPTAPAFDEMDVDDLRSLLDDDVALRESLDVLVEEQIRRDEIRQQRAAATSDSIDTEEIDRS